MGVLGLKGIRVVFFGLSAFALLCFGVFAQEISLVGADGKPTFQTYQTPQIKIQFERRKGETQEILTWDQGADDFLLALSQEIKGVFEGAGNDRVLELLKFYSDFGLTMDKMSEGLSLLQNKFPSFKEKLVVNLPAHPNSGEAIDFLNTHLEKAGYPIHYQIEANTELPDPHKLSSSSSVRNWELARLGVGPVVVGMGVATGNAPLDIPLAVTTAQQVAYELQFGKKEINSNFWKPIWEWGDRQQFLKYLTLGINPAILAVNLAYPISLYEARLALIHKFNADPSVLNERAVQYPLFILGALIFSSSYGIFQGDLVKQQITGRRSADSWFINESILNMTANSLRIGTIFFPIVMATANVFGVNYNIDLGTAGLLALATLAIPNTIKTRVGPGVRATYIRHQMEWNASGGGIRGLKLKCRALMDRLTNFYVLTRK